MAKKPHKQPEKLFTAEKLASGAWWVTKTLGALTVGIVAIGLDSAFRPRGRPPLSLRTKTTRIGAEFYRIAPPVEYKGGYVTEAVANLQEYIEEHVEAIPPIHGTYTEDLQGISPGTQDIIIAQRALRETHGIDSNQL